MFAFLITMKAYFLQAYSVNEQNYCTLQFLHEMQKYTKIKECNVGCVNLYGLGLHLGVVFRPGSVSP